MVTAAALDDSEGVENGRFRRGSWVAISAGFLLLVLAALCAVALAISEDQTSHAGRRSREVRDLQASLFSAVEDAENGQRGYLLTHDARDLAPFISAKAKLTDLDAKLGAAADGDPGQRALLKDISTLAREQTAELSRAVALQRDGDMASAIAVVRSSGARELAERLRRKSAAFDAVEERMLDARRDSLAVQRQALIWIMLAALVIAAGLAASVGLEVRRYAAALAAQNAALKREAAERAQAEAQLRQSQKMESLGQLTGGVAHDFNNMLAIVIGNLDILIRRLSGHDARMLALAENALSGASKAASLTKRLLAFSRLQPLNPSPTDVNKCVGDMSELLRRTLGEQIAVETMLGAGLWRAFIDAAQLESAILNLAVNARDAMALAGRLTIATSNIAVGATPADDHDGLDPGDYVLVAVTDTGSGMAPEVVEKAFEPFFTTKAVGDGTGLGLSQVHGFIKQSRGHVTIQTELGKGTSIRLYLPRAKSMAVPAEMVVEARPRLDNSRHTVLIVEDDPGVRAFATGAARELGFGVLEADNASTALQRLAEAPSVSVLLTDVVMPGLNGRELVDLALARRPHLPVVFMTGYTRDAIMHNGALDPGTRLLAKPFTLDDLDRELTGALTEAGAGG